MKTCFKLFFKYIYYADLTMWFSWIQNYKGNRDRDNNRETHRRVEREIFYFKETEWNEGEREKLKMR